MNVCGIINISIYMLLFLYIYLSFWFTKFKLAYLGVLGTV